MPIPNNFTPSLVPQVTLLSTIIAYPILFYFVTPRTATASRFIKSREAISVLHCTLVTLASAYELQRRCKDWDGLSTSPHFTEDDSPSSRMDDKLERGVHSGPRVAYGANAPLITTRSSVGNSIMAFELGYLLQDSVILLLATRLRKRDAGRKVKFLVKDINWKVLGWHHLGFSSALGVLQWYISQGREKGIMVILVLMLMNVTSPFGTLHWYLVNFRPERWKGIMITNALYLLIYGIFRVSIIGWVLHVMGLTCHGVPNWTFGNRGIFKAP
ncbi:hypothetical protein BKA64DRAFT_226551 [Cadophora sp. MPI-SDFR-AT-0126]|nr:hypothetical protein BKA64DRAFT_226551 [Leotiomycetes sp. MPI-SDFR-AT-0126]